MFEFINRWYRRYFTDPQASLLVVLLVVSVVILATMGKMLAPLLAALVIAYLLEGAVYKLQKKKMPRFLAVNLVYLMFVAFMIFILLVLLPILSRQISQFFKEVPDMISNGQALLLRLPEQYPELISVEYIGELISTIQGGLSELGQNVLSVSVASIPAIITILVYLILVPLMIFFFLKDKAIIIDWMGRFLPKERQLVNEIWTEMDGQIGNYVRGKSNEILIVGGVSYCFRYSWFKLCVIAGDDCWSVRFNSLSRCSSRYFAYRICCLFPVGTKFRLCLVNGLLRYYPISRWQYTGAHSFF